MNDPISDFRRFFSRLWISCADGLDVELKQAEEEGRQLPDRIKTEASSIRDMNPGLEREALAKALYARIQALPLMDGYAFDEPASNLTEILARRPHFSQVYKDMPLDSTKMYDKIYGAWIGRCAGCLLGQPVERWDREHIYGLLKDTGNFPLAHYISSDVGEEIRKKYDISDEGFVYRSKVFKELFNKV